MLSINPDVLIAQLLTFIVFLPLLWFVYLKPLGKHLRERAGAISRSLDESKAAREEAERLKADNAREMEEFKAQQKRLMDEAREEGAQLKATLLAQARSEQEALLSKARQQIQQETEAARRELKQEAAALVVEATRKVLAGGLDEKAQDAFVHKFVRDVPKTRK